MVIMTIDRKFREKWRDPWISFGFRIALPEF